MSHTVSKQELRRPDLLTAIGQNLFRHTLQNQKVVFGFLVAIFLGGVGYIVMEKTSLKKELEIQEQFYSIEKGFLKKKEAFDKVDADKKNPPTPKGSEANTKAETKVAPEVVGGATGDLSKDYSAEVEGWTKLIESHPQSKGGAMAALELSQLYLKYSKSAEALQVLSKVQSQQGSHTLLGAMVHHAYANLLANQNRCPEAVSIWENLEKSKALVFLVDQAKLGRALCLDSMAQVEKAEVLLRELVIEKPSMEKQAQTQPKSSVQRSAEKFLRYLQLKKNMKQTTSSSVKNETL